MGDIEKVRFTVEQQAKVDRLIDITYARAKGKAEMDAGVQIIKLKAENAVLKNKIDELTNKKFFSFWRI